MIKDRRYFTGGINVDDAYQAMSESDLLNVFNASYVMNRDGKSARLEFYPGTRKLQYSYPSGDGTIIATALDTAKSRVFFFRYNSSGEHGIYCLTPSGVLKVVENSDVTGGLGFSDEKLINGARVVDGLLYWNQPGTDNGQKRINVEAALKASNPSYQTSVQPYSYPIKSTMISLYRKQPSFPPAATKFEQLVPAVSNNYVVTSAFQFAYRYNYRDGEISKMSPLSRLAPFNKSTDTFNCIDVEIPTIEKIEQDVSSIDLLVRYGNSGGYFIIKTWDKRKTQDATEISNHNANTSPLKFRFFNDQVGTPVPESYSVSQFDSIPISSETMEVMKNRVFLGNNKEGYDTPSKTSLTSSISSSDALGESRWVLLTVRVNLPGAIDDGAISEIKVLDIMNMGAYNGFYKYVGAGYPTSVSFPSLTYLFTGPSGVYAWSVANNYEIISFEYTGGTATVTDGPVSVDVIGKSCMKSGATYQPAIVFADEFGRKCGVVVADKIAIPERKYSLPSYTKEILWQLSNADSVNEIPSWAHYYIPCLTRCLTTTFFIQRRAVAMTYVGKDTAGAYTFNTSTYSTSLVGIGVDISDLPSVGFGYTFQEGDIIKLYASDDSAPKSFKIVGTSGRWVICELANIGTLNSSTNMLYEIYSPYYGSINEFYYERGDVFQVTNPGLPDRSYSVLSGTFYGDVYLLSRKKGANDYLTENMSNNDKVWQTWLTDQGRPNIVDSIGQRVKRSNISFSNTKIPETGVNGMSSFDPLDESNSVPAEMGPIRKLIAASRTISDGTVMLCICESDTASIYIGETQVTDSAGQSILSATFGVIGTISPLRGGFGTVNPESVVSWNGNVFWFDLNRASVCMYGGGGIEVPSEMKAATLFKKFSTDYITWQSGGQSGRIRNSGYGHVFGVINPSDGSYMIRLPRLYLDSDAPPLYDTILEEL